MYQNYSLALKMEYPFCKPKVLKCLNSGILMKIKFKNPNKSIGFGNL